MKRMLLNLFCCFIFLFQTAAYAAKPPLILMPVQGKGLTTEDRDNYRIALQEGMSSRYTVFGGAEVEKKLQKHSAKTCDANSCLQEVAIEFQGELIGRLVVTPSGSGYVLAVEIKNIFDDKVVESRNIPCEGCNSFAVMRKLKELGEFKSMEKAQVSISSLPLMKGASIFINDINVGKVPATFRMSQGVHEIRIQTGDYIGVQKIGVQNGDKKKFDIALLKRDADKPEEEDEGWSMPWWGWVLGAAALAGGGGGGGGDSAAASTGEVTATW